MSEHSKKYTNKEEFRKANFALIKYQKRHNIIRKDFELLLKITIENQEKPERFNTLYRACIKGILSLIESDIFGLNEVDIYEGYDDKHCFEDKFKRTFKQVCKTWNKSEIIQKYLDEKYGALKKVKSKRDKLIHPKNTEDIAIASISGYNELKDVFFDYTKMLHAIMDDFYINIVIKDLNEIADLFKD